MQTEQFLAQIRGAAGQTDMAPYVSLRDQRDMYLPLFPVDQSEIGEKLETLLSRKALLFHQNQTLASLRDTLLPKLISGELRIGDAEKRIAAA